MRNSERFLTAFNTLENFMQKTARAEPHEGFSGNVHRAGQRNPRVRRYKDALIEYAQLRNAIVHGPSGEKVLAEPNDEVVAEIERIAELLTQPPPVSQFVTRNVKTLHPDDPLRKALGMFEKETFSQIPIYSYGRFVGLLTTTAVVRWIGGHLDNGLDVNGATAADVMDNDEEYIFLRPEEPADTALAAFEERLPKGRRLRVILVSENGKPDGQLVGILTVWDLPAIYRRVG